MSEKRLMQALECLNGLIDDGMEYPDAEWKVATSFGINSELLRMAYDEQSE